MSLCLLAFSTPSGRLLLGESSLPFSIGKQTAIKFFDELPGVKVGVAEQEALDVLDATTANKFQRFFAVDHLGDSFYFHGFARHHQRLQERAALECALGIFDSTAIELHHVDFEHAQVLEAGRSRTEVIEALIETA